MLFSFQLGNSMSAQAVLKDAIYADTEKKQTSLEPFTTTKKGRPD